jgi:hypothetical protein
MKVDSMLPYLVTLGFLAIWALTHIFNREAEPLPPRAGRPPNGPGVRPQPPAGPARRPEPPMRWSTPPGGSPAARVPAGRVARLDDDIVILEVEPPKRTPPPARPAATGSTRRAPRGRAPAGQAAKRPETPAGKPLGAPLSATIAPLVNRPVEFKPLALPQETLQTVESSRKGEPAGATASAEPAASRALDFAALARSPTRLRESFILSEILQPPVALRQTRR